MTVTTVSDVLHHPVSAVIRQLAPVRPPTHPMYSSVAQHPVSGGTVCIQYHTRRHSPVGELGANRGGPPVRFERRPGERRRGGTSPWGVLYERKD